jgi:ribosomal protein L37AE/L43A
MKELAQIDRAAIDRPVTDLPRDKSDIIEIITHKNGSEGQPHLGNGNGHTHADRVKEAIGNMYMDITCSNCGSSKVIRAGACGCCTECGTSQGCS